MKYVTLGICRDDQNAPEIKSGAGDSHTILIPPNDGSGCPGRVHTLYIDPVDGSDCPCVEPDKLQSNINFSFGSESKEVPNYDTPEPSDTKTETTFDNHPTISFPIVETCKLIGMTLDGSGPVDNVAIVQVTPGADCFDDPGEYRSHHTDNQLIPGMLIRLRSYLDCPSPGNVVDGDSEIWNTCSLTGGIITALNGEYDEADHTFDISLMTGQSITIAPTDWKPYRVGDWVTVLTVGGNCETLNNKGNLEWTSYDKILIAPMYYGKYPLNPGLTGGDLDFSLNDNKPVMHLRNIPATILSIDADANTADVMTDAFGQLDGVAFAWNCPESDDFDGAYQAYEVDDVVNLVIPGIAFDAHIDGPAIPPAPYIMGWQDMEMRACNPFLYYMGDPIECRDTEGNIIPDEDCGDDETYKYHRKFDVKQKLVADVNITDEHQKGLTINKLCLPWTDPDKSGHGSLLCTRTDSVMLDRWTAHAIAWKVLVVGGAPRWYWAVTVDYNGVQWQFEEPLSLPPKYTSTWPKQSNPFGDLITCSNVSSTYGTFKPVHAFDLWQLESDISTRNWNQDDYMLSICGEGTTLHVWNLTQNDYYPYLTGLSQRVAADFPDLLPYGEHAEQMIRILGCKKFDCFFTVASMRYGKLKYFHEIYKYDALADEITRYNQSGHGVLYNRFTEEIWYVDHGEIAATGVPSEWSVFDFSAQECHLYPTYPNPCVQECCEIIHRLTGAHIGYQGSGPQQATQWSEIRENTGTAYNGFMDGTKTTNARVDRRALFSNACRHCGSTNNNHFLGYSVFCTVYGNWIADIGYMGPASITKNGAGEKRTLDIMNGKGSCVDPNKDDATVVATDFEFGDFSEDYASDDWPHIAAYTHIKHALDKDGNEYENIVIQQDNDGDTEYGENEAIFFAVNANYAPEND